MGHIFKYEMIRRSKNILILGGLMLGMTIISTMLVLALGTPLYDNKLPTYAKLWLVINFISIVLIPIVMFFTCCHAHITEFLFKDTNYLMLTLPLAAWKILLGRWLAGLCEYLIYAVSALFCSFIYFTSIFIRHYNLLLKILRGVFLNISANPAGVFVFIAYCLATFALVGMTIIMLNMIIRAFIKKRGLTTAISIVVCIFLFFLLNNFAANLSDTLNLVVYIPVKTYNIEIGGLVTSETFEQKLHLVVPLIWTVLATGFFFVSSWLLEKKVEV